MRQIIDAKAIIVREEQGKDLFLLLKDKHHKWTLPGVMFEGQEDEMEDTLEETLKNMRITRREVSDGYMFKEENHYHSEDKEDIILTTLASAIRTDTLPNQIDIGNNYLESRWFPYSTVLYVLRSPNQKDAFKTVCQFTGLNKQMMAVY